ncbi:MAG: DEAD/DEAH box helicase [Sterolibacterium sp.]|nr:DEAD/DEAH box helicase [Sterolibacterium sp.]
MKFTELGLRAEILRAIDAQGYTDPTPIQAQAIPLVLAGHDLMAAAQTGTGKTAGFTLPILQLISSRPPQGGRPRPRVLVLTPTRELAAQVAESVHVYGQHLPLKTAVIFGGVSMGPQEKALKSGVDILVATPGRLLDHLGQGTASLDGVEILVLDEADRMLDMGFLPDMKKLFARLPKERQTLLYSATFSDDIRRLAAGLLREPRSVDVAPRNSTTELVSQKVYPVDKARKRDLLIKLIQDHNWHQVLVFTRTKHGANTLADKLDKAGISAAAIHGNKSQNARTRALADFKSMKLNVLVATDIAARGIDIDLLPHVVNYELPNVPEDYVHRIGRTGRAGSVGQAASLVCVDELQLLRNIERLIKQPIERCQIEGFEPDPSIKPEPIENGRDNRRNPGRGGDGRQGQGRNQGGRATSASAGGLAARRGGGGASKAGRSGHANNRPPRRSSTPNR